MTWLLTALDRMENFVFRFLYICVSYIYPFLYISVSYIYSVAPFLIYMHLYFSDCCCVNKNYRRFPKSHHHFHLFIYMVTHKIIKPCDVIKISIYLNIFFRVLGVYCCFMRVLCTFLFFNW